MRLAFFGGIIICATLLSACLPKRSAECSKEAGFLNLSPEEQSTQFRSFPIEKQVEIFICDYRYVHPFHTGWAQDIAKHGDGAIPFLSEKMKTERDANNLGAIIYVLGIMFKYDYLRNKVNAAQTIRQAIPEMKCDSSKNLCNELREEIERIIASQQ